jgi:peptidoglycan hydrolase CwlO-like protein
MTTETRERLNAVCDWLRANGAVLLLCATIAGSAWAVGKSVVAWIYSQDIQGTNNQYAITEAAAKIALLQKDVVSIDARLVELRARMVELHTTSDTAEAMLKARLDTIDSLNDLLAKYATRPPLPTPLTPPVPGPGHPR